MTIEQLTTFFGWCALLNYMLLIITSVMLLFMQNTVIKTHQYFFDLPKEELLKSYFGFLANFKILTIAFFLIPYIALKLI